MTYRELIYACLDLCKILSDDATFTEEHIKFLANKYRIYLIEQKYKDVKKTIPISNLQTICLNMEQYDLGTCEGTLLKSKEQIPTISTVISPRIYLSKFTNVTFVSYDKFKYVNYNKFLKNIIYATLDKDNYLYFKSSNPQFLYIELAQIQGLFEDADEASNMSCDNDTNCDIYDKKYPIEEGLIPLLIQSIIKDILGASYKPNDDYNNAKDDFADLMNFIRNNSKSNLQKQIDGE